MLKHLAFVFWGFATLGLSHAQMAAEVRLPRWNEDYSHLAGKAPTNFHEKLKHIKGQNSYLSLGGEYRLIYARIENDRFGAATPDPDGNYFNRAMVHVDYHPTANLRFFADFVSAFNWGHRVPALPPQRDDLDLHQLFFETKWSVRDTKASYLLRMGRQEMRYGSERILSLRERPNVRLSLDGIVIVRDGTEDQISLFYARPVIVESGIFDDNSSFDQAIWGLYFVRTQSSARRIDVYYFGHDHQRGVYVQGRGHENRHSLGLRGSGQSGDWEYDSEVIYQFGRFAAGEIQAWMLALGGGYVVRRWPFTPKFSLKASATSGDRDRQDLKLQTFNALSPRGRYYGWTSILGPSNLVDLHPEMKLMLSRQFRLLLDWDFYWRQTLDDGIYAPSGRIVRSGGTSRAPFVGSQLALELIWKAGLVLDFGVSYARFFPGGFIKESGAGKDMEQTNVWMLTRF